MKSVLYHPLVILIVSGVSLLFYFSLIKSDQKLIKTKETVATLNQEVTQLENQAKELQEKVEYASSSAAREKILRDELLMQKPGEYILQLPPQAHQQPEMTPSPSPTAWEEWRMLLL